MISEADFFMGRDLEFPEECTPIVRANAAETVRRYNLLEAAARDDGVDIDGIPYNAVASGWRPVMVNDHTSNAAEHSDHIPGRAIDRRDHDDRRFARWCIARVDLLRDVRFWAERAQWCAKQDKNGKWWYWQHLQQDPPRSGRRFYIPSVSAPLVAALPGEIDLANVA